MLAASTSGPAASGPSRFSRGPPSLPRGPRAAARRPLRGDGLRLRLWWGPGPGPGAPVGGPPAPPQLAAPAARERALNRAPARGPGCPQGRPPALPARQRDLGFWGLAPWPGVAWPRRLPASECATNDDPTRKSEVPEPAHPRCVPTVSRCVVSHLGPNFRAAPDRCVCLYPSK